MSFLKAGLFTVEQEVAQGKLNTSAISVELKEKEDCRKKGLLESISELILHSSSKKVKFDS